MINKWGKMKKFFLLIGSLILYAPLLFGFAASAHNTDIGYILYGYSTWEEMQKAPNNVQLSYFIVSDAAVFAIDYQAIGDNGSDKYNELQQNINKTSKSFKLPDISSFITIGGGSHRAYNHQGFYYNYLNAAKYTNNSEEDALKRNERWDLGKNKILIPSIECACNLNQKDPRAELIALFVYYTHMIGDLAEGKPSSISQMKDISSYYRLLSSFISDLETASRKCSQYKSYSCNQLIIESRMLKRIITNNSGTSDPNRQDYGADWSSYIKVRELFRKYFPLIINEIGVVMEA